MKFFKIIFNILLITMIATKVTAQVLPNPQVTGAIVNPAPLAYPGGGASVSFTFVNSSPTLIPALAGNHINITLSKLGVNGTFNAATNITGPGAAYFTFTYNPVLLTLTATQNAIIPGFAGGQIIFNNLAVTGESTSINPQNGLNVNVVFLAAFNSSTTDDNVSNFTFTAAGGPLLVKLLSFNALKQINSVDLKWQTSSEQNSNYFDVEFSSDGNVWQSIGRVLAAGNSNSQQNYSLTHTTPVKGANYYRLKQVDKNGNAVYSEIRVINFGGKGSITILPNPVVDQVYISSNNNSVFTSVKLFSTDGKQLQEYTNFTSGNSISMSNYPAGAYVLKVTDKEGNVEVDKLIKQ